MVYISYSTRAYRALVNTLQQVKVTRLSRIFILEHFNLALHLVIAHWRAKKKHYEQDTAKFYLQVYIYTYKKKHVTQKTEKLLF